MIPLQCTRVCPLSRQFRNRHSAISNLVIGNSAVLKSILGLRNGAASVFGWFGGHGEWRASGHDWWDQWRSLFVNIL